MKKNKITIIGGKWRQKSVEFIDADGLRPTPIRIRETLFNWLSFDLKNTTVLDLFAGSGILSFEALSRGAVSATLIESNQKVYHQLVLTKNNLDKQIKAEIIHQSAYDYCRQSEQTFDYIFLDPPFGRHNLGNLLQQISTQSLLNPCGKIYVESQMALTNDFLPEGMVFLKQKQASSVYYGLIELS